MHALQSVGGMTLADLHRQTLIPKASLLRILKTLMEAGTVWRFVRIRCERRCCSFCAGQTARATGWPKVPVMWRRHWPKPGRRVLACATPILAAILMTGVRRLMTGGCRWRCRSGWAAMCRER